MTIELKPQWLKLLSECDPEFLVRNVPEWYLYFNDAGWDQVLRTNPTLVKVYPYQDKLRRFITTHRKAIAEGLAVLEDKKKIIEVLNFIEPYVSELDFYSIKRGNVPFVVQVISQHRPAIRIGFDFSAFKHKPLTFDADGELIAQHSWLYRHARVYVNSTVTTYNREKMIGIPVLETEVVKQLDTATNSNEKRWYRRSFVHLVLDAALKHELVVTDALKRLLSDKRLIRYIPEDMYEPFLLYLIKLANLPWIGEFITKEEILSLADYLNNKRGVRFDG